MSCALHVRDQTKNTIGYAIIAQLDEIIIKLEKHLYFLHTNKDI